MDENAVEVQSEASLEQVLQKYCKRYPKNEKAYSEVHSASSSLKESIKTDNFSYKDVANQISKLAKVYSEGDTKETKEQITIFAVETRLPKVYTALILHLRKLHEDLTKWDRENTKTLLSKPKTKKARYTRGIQKDNEKIEKKEAAQFLLLNMAHLLMCYADESKEFAVGCGEAELIDLLLQMIDELQDCIPSHVRFVDETTQKLKRQSVRGEILANLLGLLYNLLRHTGDRFLKDDSRAIWLLLPLSKIAVPEFAVDSLLCLAYIIDEANNRLVMSGTEPIKFIIKALNMTLTQHSRRYLGYSSHELADGLSHIALNDENKKKIGQCGGIKTLVQMLVSAQNDQERQLATKALWTLAFDEDNKRIIYSDSLCLKELRKMANSDNPDLQKTAAGVLWEIEGKQKHIHSSEKAQPSDSSSKETKDTNKKHVMISYQWDVQETMIKVKNKLQAAGYKVWMDLEQMRGSTLEAMANAVEKSAVVVIGVSQRYKDSPNCRSEAEYAFSLRKDIVPLMMQDQYRADGWLGMILGSKLRFNFAQASIFETSIEALKKELGVRGKTDCVDCGVPIVKAKQHKEVSSPVEKIKSWSKTDVCDWLERIGLESKICNKAKERLDGSMLARLQDLRQECAESFYKFVKTGLEITDPFDAIQFTDELAKLDCR